jgi:hypothetical protein
MWIIYDCEKTPVGTLTDSAIEHTTIKEWLEHGDCYVEKCADYSEEDEDE